MMENNTVHEQLKVLLKKERVLANQFMKLNKDFNKLVDALNEPIENQRELLHKVLKDNADVLGEYRSNITNVKIESEKDIIMMITNIRTISFTINDKHDEVSAEVNVLFNKLSKINRGTIE